MLEESFFLEGYSINVADLNRKISLQQSQVLLPPLLLLLLRLKELWGPQGFQPLLRQWWAPSLLPHLASFQKEPVIALVSLLLPLRVRLHLQCLELRLRSLVFHLSFSFFLLMAFFCCRFLLSCLIFPFQASSS